MINTIGGGGLGDAVMVFSKLQKIYGDCETVKHTHVMIQPTLMKSVKEFYESQNIDVKVEKIPNWKWMNKNKENYDKNFDTSAYGNNDKIEINPFPEFNVYEKKMYDIVISPSSGRNNERNFFFNEIRNFIEKYSNKYEIALIGKEKNREQFKKLNVVNLINKTNIKESINIINNSKLVIAPSGFVSFIGCMMNKKVFTKDNRIQIRKRYYHKSWNNKFINNLNEIQI